MAKNPQWYTLHTFAVTERKRTILRGESMKKLIYTILAGFLLPIIFVGAVIYGVAYVLQLLFRTINLQLEKGMRWVDKNITPNL